MRIRLSFPLLFGVGGLVFLGVDRASPQDFGPELCGECHEEQVASLQPTAHSALDTEGLAAKADAESSCTACHGDPTEHLEEGTAEAIFNFSDEDLPTVKSQKCLTCHGSEHPRFRASPHAQAGMDCLSCHSIHSEETHFAQLEAWPDFRSSTESLRVSESCRECHTDVFAQFEFNERHRLQEGILDCVSCHNPHEPATRALLGGFKQQQCANCHTDKNGPFVFEHGSVRVEGCTACHAPHGSVNRHMLAFQNVAELCFSCHVAIPGFHARFTLESQCTNCHSTIHGSNLDPFFLK